MSIYIPYFYIIRHKESGRLYAGSKYGKDANPDKFMIEGGYTTSCNLINSIIEISGISAFEVLLIDTYCDGFHPFDYETIFLQTLDCASNDMWINDHNNDWIDRTVRGGFGTPNFELSMVEKYGVSNCSKLEKVKESKRLKSLKKYGTVNPAQSEEVKIKMTETCLEKYGTEFYFNSKEFKLKSISTNLEKYGTEYAMSNEEVKERWIKTFAAKYGVENPSQLESVKQSKEQTSIKNYGVSCYWLSEESKQKRRKTNLEKYGAETYFESENAKKLNSDKRKQENSMKFLCKHCEREIGGLANFRRFHGDKCKLAPK